MKQKERKYFKQYTKNEIVTAIKKYQSGELKEKELNKIILSANESATEWLISKGILEPTKQNKGVSQWETIYIIW